TATAKSTKEAIKPTGNTRATVAADAGVNSQSNKQVSEASIHSQAGVSGKETSKSVNALNHKVKADTKAKAAQAVNTTAVAKTKVVNTVKPRPVAVKMQARVKGNAGIKIK
ncbi:MAG TPA: hypothetical protein VK645_00460, partial [Chitinophagaceae bacterium]|nr:hypothetical protein [Chitinophagaceae bacterium]